MKNIDRKKGVLDVEGTRRMNMLWNNLKHSKQPKKKEYDIYEDPIFKRMFEDD